MQDVEMKNVTQCVPKRLINDVTEDSHIYEKALGYSFIFKVTSDN